MEFTTYFRNENDRCRFRSFQKDGKLVYEVALMTINGSLDAEVFYIERFRKIENAILVMDAKGVDFDEEYEPDMAELNLWRIAFIYGALTF